MKLTPIQDLHPVELILVCILFIFATIFNLCTPSLAGVKKLQSKELNDSESGTTATPSTKVSRPRSRSTKSGTTTVVQKKADGPSVQATQSKPSVSSQKRKPSGFSTNFTKSTMQKNTTEQRMTSAFQPTMQNITQPEDHTTPNV